MADDAAMAELRLVCSGAQEMVEAGIRYVFLPGLKLPCAPGVVDGLLALQPHSGYATRLFLSQPVPGKGSNWSIHQILGRGWHTWSWKDIPGNLRPIEILRNHLEPLK